MRIIWKEYCPGETQDLAFLTNFQLMADAGTQGPIDISLHYHTLNMKSLWTQLASFFPWSAGGRRAFKFMGHFKAHLVNLSCFSLSYTFYLQNFLSGKLAALIWEDVITSHRLKITFGFCIISRCSTNQGYLIGKVVKIRPSLWELSVTEKVSVNHLTFLEKIHFDSRASKVKYNAS